MSTIQRLIPKRPPQSIPLKPLAQNLLPTLQELKAELETIDDRLAQLAYYSREAMGLRDERNAIEWEMRGWDNLYSD